MTAKRNVIYKKKIGSHRIRRQIQIAKSRGKIFDPKLKDTKIKQNESIQNKSNTISEPEIQAGFKEQGIPIY